MAAATAAAGKVEIDLEPEFEPGEAESAAAIGTLTEVAGPAVAGRARVVATSSAATAKTVVAAGQAG